MRIGAILATLAVLAIAPRALKPALYAFTPIQRSAGASTPAATMVGIPDRINQHVSIASGGDLVAVVWAASKAGSSTDIYAAIGRDEGRSFSAPVRVNASGASADVGGEQPPQVVVTGSGSTASIVVVWTAKGEAGTRVLTARSSDAGKTFTTPSIVPGSDGAGNRGWESIAVDARGRVFALWLDHREMAASGGAGAHHHGAEASAGSGAVASDGAARAQSSQLYFAAVGDGAAARGIARGVCYCCKTALITGAGDAIFAAWRQVYPGNLRDMAFAASRDGGRTFSAPVRVSEDGWQIDGCPENGPALAVDAAQRTHIIWPTVVRGKGESALALFHASTADGRTFTARSPLPVSGAAYHPRLIAMRDGALLAAWDEVVNGARRIRVAGGRPDAQGRVSFSAIELAQPIQAQYPALAAARSGAVLAWSTGAAVGSRISIARVPADPSRGN